jgi:hypothetical protein
MKALKTIVATAVIVFALTTAAMAGARHFSSWGDSSSPAAGPAAAETHQGGMTLTDDRFARLLHAVNDQAAKLHTPQADRETTRERVRARSRQTAGDSARHAQAQHHPQSQNASGGTHDHGTQGGSTHHADTHHSGGTHDAGSHHE